MPAFPRDRRTPVSRLSEEDGEQGSIGAAITAIQLDRVAERSQRGRPTRPEHQVGRVAVERDHLVVANTAQPEVGRRVQVVWIGAHGRLVSVAARGWPLKRLEVGYGEDG